MEKQEVKSALECLSEVQNKLKAPKSQMNKFGNYRYRSCEDILTAVKPHLKEVNAVLTLSDDVVVIGDWHYIKATATFKTENGEVAVWGYARESEVKKGMDDSQITGSASSYARKYALNGLFAIDDTRDSDATNTDDPKASKTKLDQVVALGGNLEKICAYYKHSSVDELTEREIDKVLSRLTTRSAQ